MAKRLIIDTNLLLLLVIGAVEGGRHIRNSDRLNAFTTSEYDNVIKIMQDYDDVFITPYIATEVSNLIDLNGHARIQAYKIAQNLFCNVFKKIDVDLAADCASEFFERFGITDASLINLAPDYDILTCDYKLLIPLFASSPDKIIPFSCAN